MRASIGVLRICHGPGTRPSHRGSFGRLTNSVQVPSQLHRPCTRTRRQDAGDGQYVQQKTTNGPLREVVDNVVVGAQGHNDNVVPTLDCLGVSEPTFQRQKAVIDDDGGSLGEVWDERGERDEMEIPKLLCGTSNNGKTPKSNSMALARSGQLDPPPWGYFLGRRDGASGRARRFPSMSRVQGSPTCPRAGFSHRTPHSMPRSRGPAVAALRCRRLARSVLGQSLASEASRHSTLDSPSFTTRPRPRPPSHTAVALSPKSLFFSCFESEAIHSLVGAQLFEV